MYQAVDRKLSELDPGRLDALEISGTNYRDKPWRSYSELHYPAFDLCDPPDELSPQADIVLCDQVLEHVRDPFAAARTLFDLCRPGGWCFVATPFLYRIHAAPDDFWRFTPHGLAQVLGEAGFDDIDAQWWGNKACVKACLTGDPIYRGWRSLRSPDHALPVVVWAFARKNSS